MIKAEEEVRSFLEKVQGIIDESDRNLIILGRTKTDNKTRNFMNKYNIKHKMVCEEILKLDVSNYSYTDFDDNPNWAHEEVWFFGQVLMIEGVKFRDTIYIKLKLKDNIVCMSFHPQEFELKYPYL